MSQVLQECRLKRYIYLIYLGRETSCISCTINTPYLTSRYRKKVFGIVAIFGKVRYLGGSQLFSAREESWVESVDV